MADKFGPDWFDEPAAPERKVTPLTDISLICWACYRATRAHCDAKQMRRDPLYPLPYIVHPLRVAMLVGACGGSAVAVAAALLHDVLEDTPTVPLGWPTEVTALVMSLAHKHGQTKLEAIEQLASAPEEALLIKLADRYDNSSAEANGAVYFQRPDVMESTERLLQIVVERKLELGKCRSLYDALDINLKICSQANAREASPDEPVRPSSKRAGSGKH